MGKRKTAPNRLLGLGCRDGVIPVVGRGEKENRPGGQAECQQGPGNDPGVGASLTEADLGRRG